MEYSTQLLPSTAPEKWPGKWHSKEEVDVFFGRVWSEYLKLGLDSATLKKYDLKLWEAIRKFETTYKRPWPKQYKLETTHSKLQTSLSIAKKEFSALTPKQQLAVARKNLRCKQVTPN